jgi:dTDP-4-dehydrorhamnose 3,5-epimerase
VHHGKNGKLKFILSSILLVIFYKNIVKKFMNQFKILDLSLKGLKLISKKKKEDKRGFLSRIFCFDELNKSLGIKPIKQINHTLTIKVGTVKGFHYQVSPSLEMKIVTCLKGKVFDVVVDLRKNSPTFLKKHYQILSDENFYSIVIPEGFAHGFQTLTDNCEMIYFHTSNYNPINERGVCYDDPTLNVSWPLPVDLVSIKDKQYEYIGKSFQGVNVE